MNWYKLAQLESTLPYFQEFGEENYVPNQDKLNSTLREKYNTEISYDIGQGDSGVAYQLSNGDVLKITTNGQEAQVAEWLISNPNPNIVAYKDVWQEGDLFYIVMEKLDSLLETNTDLAQILDNLISILDKKQCYNVECALKILSVYKDSPTLVIIRDYLQHLINIPQISIFDFLNPQNIGFKNGKLKFFDIT